MLKDVCGLCWDPSEQELQGPFPYVGLTAGAERARGGAGCCPCAKGRRWRRARCCCNTLAAVLQLSQRLDMIFAPMAEGREAPLLGAPTGARALPAEGLGALGSWLQTNSLAQPY